MTPPPSGQSSWAWSTRSPSPYTTVSSKPTATRNSIIARASRAWKVPQTDGAGVLSLMASVWPVAVPTVLDVSALLGQPRGRAAAGHLPELPGEVALVGVPGNSRDLGQARRSRRRAREMTWSKRNRRHSSFGDRPSSATIRLRSCRGLSSTSRRGPRPGSDRGRPRRAARQPHLGTYDGPAIVVHSPAQPRLHDVEPVRRPAPGSPPARAARAAAAPSTSWPWSPGPISSAARQPRSDAREPAGVRRAGRPACRAGCSTRAATGCRPATITSYDVARSGSKPSPSSTVPETRTGPSTETMKVIHGDGRPRWLPLRLVPRLVGDRRCHRTGQHVRPGAGSGVPPGTAQSPSSAAVCSWMRPSVAERRSPVPPHRPAMISAAMLTAVSSGVRAPRSRPIGLESRASSSSVSAGLAQPRPGGPRGCAASPSRRRRRPRAAAAPARAPARRTSGRGSARRSPCAGRSGRPRPRP